MKEKKSTVFNMWLTRGICETSSYTTPDFVIISYEISKKTKGNKAVLGENPSLLGIRRLGIFTNKTTERGRVAWSTHKREHWKMEGGLKNTLNGVLREGGFLKIPVKRRTDRGKVPRNTLKIEQWQREGSNALSYFHSLRKWDWNNQWVRFPVPFVPFVYLCKSSQQAVLPTLLLIDFNRYPFPEN